MKAVILAGGKGERLGELTENLPKPMIAIGGIPVLEHQLACLGRYGIDVIYLLTGYRGEAIKDHFGNGEPLGVTLHYIREKEPLGTAGCVRQLDKILTDDFLVVYGDILFDLKLDDFIAFHKTKKGIATVVAHPTDHPYDSDLLVMDQHDRVERILFKNNKPDFYQNLGNAAFYILSPRVLPYIPAGEQTDFMADIFPRMLDAGEPVYAYRTAEYIKDMGTPDRLSRVERDFETGKVARLAKTNKRPAIFLDRDGTLVRDVGLLHRPEALELLSGVPQAIKQINMSDYLAILVTNQSVVARNLCDLADLQEIHNKLETLLGKEAAYLDAIFFCPHHPDKGFPEENPAYKIECGCRKPKTGMIEKAIEKYNIERTISWMIGDTTIDILTGINAGLKTVLVRTGHGGKDGRFEAEPDLVFNNLAETVETILLR